MSTYSVYNIEVDDKILIDDGSGAAPSLTFTGDSDTGMYRSATDEIGFSAGGIATMQVKETGVTVLALDNLNRTFHTLTDAATISWDYSDGYNAKVTLGGNRSLSIGTVSNGDYGTLVVTQDGTGTRVINFGANDKFASATHSFSTGSGDVDIFTWVYDGTDFIWNYNNDFA
jgi:hypothetical protein